MRPIDTPEFWAQVKADLEGSNFETLCYSSLAFKAEWYSSENFNIRDLASDFLRESDKYDMSMLGDGIILFNVYGTTFEFDRAVRFDFLDYMIEKTSRNDD